MLLELWQSWCNDHLPRESVPEINTLSVWGVPFPNVQSELPLTQLHCIFSFPIAGHPSEISTCPSPACCEEAVACNEGSPQFPLLQAEQTKLSQPLVSVLPSRPFTILAELLWTHSNSLMSLYWGILQHYRAEWDNPLSWQAGDAEPDAPQDTVGSFGCWALLTHI